MKKINQAEWLRKKLNENFISENCFRQSIKEAVIFHWSYIIQKGSIIKININLNSNRIELNFSDKITSGIFAYFLNYYLIIKFF